MDYQWYPGHMTKAIRMMKENIQLVDLVIEIVDARIPLSSRNPDIDELGKGKSRILIMGKADLADPALTEEFCRYFEERGMFVLAADSRSARSGKEVKAVIRKASAAKRERDLKRGIKGRPVRAMVCGIPNVGKSTFINSLCGRASAKTGNKPGVTKGKQWIALGNEVQLLDTPGILWPKFEDQSVGVKLALTGSIREEILDETELALELAAYLLTRYPSALQEKYGKTDRDLLMEELLERAVSGAEGRPLSGRTRLDIPEEALYEVLTIVAVNRNLLAKGQEPDMVRAAHLMLDDFKNGRTGRITLDPVPSVG